MGRLCSIDHRPPSQHQQKLACLQLYSSKQGDGPPRTDHQLWLESLQRMWSTLIQWKAELMEMDCSALSFLLSLFLFIYFFSSLKIIIWHFYWSPRRKSLITWPPPTGRWQVRMGPRAVLLLGIEVIHCLSQGHFRGMDGRQWWGLKDYTPRGLCEHTQPWLLCFYHLHSGLSWFGHWTADLLPSGTARFIAYNELPTDHSPTGSWALLSDPPRKTAGQSPRRYEWNKTSAAKIRQCGKSKMSSVSNKHPNHKFLLETWQPLMMGINCTARKL